MESNHLSKNLFIFETFLNKPEQQEILLTEKNGGTIYESTTLKTALNKKIISENTAELLLETAKLINDYNYLKKKTPFKLISFLN